MNIKERELRPIFYMIRNSIKYFIKGCNEGMGKGFIIAYLILIFPFILIFTRRITKSIQKIEI